MFHHCCVVVFVKSSNPLVHGESNTFVLSVCCIARFACFVSNSNCFVCSLIMCVYMFRPQCVLLCVCFGVIQFVAIISSILWNVKIEKNKNKIILIIIVIISVCFLFVLICYFSPLLYSTHISSYTLLS